MVHRLWQCKALFRVLHMQQITIPDEFYHLHDSASVCIVRLHLLYLI